MFCLGRYCIVSNVMELFPFFLGVLLGVVVTAIGMWRALVPRKRDERLANPEQPGPKGSPYAN